MFMGELSGRVLKTYEIAERVGLGGFGSVYRAVQSNIAREVAVKVILPEHADHPDFIRRFETEAQLVARLEHPHIVPLYDYWREPGGAYLVMRYLRGGSLRDDLDENPAWDLVRVVRLVNQIASALTFAHRSGVIHRDLKSDNILLDNEGNAYLTDFGIAKDLGHNAQITKDALLGTPAYLAPEQIRGEVATPQSDIYALGILTFEALTASKPFIDATPATVLFKQLNDPLPNVCKLRPEIPAAVNEVLQRATSKDASQRYESALAFARALQFAAQLSTDTPLPDSTVIQGTTTLEAELMAHSNPYKGLRAFQQSDAEDFFGREALVAHLLARLDPELAYHSFLAVVGPSGSGKSSVVKAGLLPAIRSGHLGDENDWYIAEMVPGTHPMEEVEAALLAVASSSLPGLLQQLKEDERGLVRAVKRLLPTQEGRVLLFIDQFEEVFTLVDSEQERKHFLNSLLAAVSDARSRLTVVITLRADFYDRPLNYGPFGELIRQRTELVLPLNEDELEAAISGPAKRVGVVLESGLVSAIVNDVDQQPGALPLLQYALTELFERREGRAMTLAAYEDIGGTAGALARRAEEVYESLKPEEQALARQVFLRLVTLGDGTEDTRRRVLQAELLSLRPEGPQREMISNILERYGKYRLLTFDRDLHTRSSTIEVAHEALIRQWERLRGWLDDNREALRLHRRLSASSHDWLNSGKDASFLASGVRLQQLEELAAEGAIDLNASERDFVQASIAHRDAQQAAERARQEREARLERQSRNRLRLLAGAMSIAALVGAILAAIAINESQRAVAAQRIAEDNAATASGLALAANARNALSGNDPQLALALAIAAEEKAGDSPEVLRVLANTTFAEGPRYRLNGHEGSVLNVAFSADGQYGVSGALDGSIAIWDLRSGKSIRRITTNEGLYPLDVAFHPQDNRVAAALNDGSVRLYDFETGAELAVWQSGALENYSLAFSPDGSSLIVGGADHIVRRWDVAIGELVQTYEGHTGVILRVAYTHDGTRFVSATGDETMADTGADAQDRSLRVWDVETGDTLHVIEPRSGFVRALAISPDDRLIAAGVWDSADSGTARLYDLETGEEIRRFFAHSTSQTDFAFSPDGRLLATTAWDRTLKLWDLQRGVELLSFTGFEDRLLSIDFSPTGGELLIGMGNYGDNEVVPERERAIDTSVWVWDILRGDQVYAYQEHGEWLWAVALDPTDTLAAVAGGPLRLPSPAADGSLPRIDTSIRVWDVSSGETVNVLAAHTNTVDSLAFHPDGRLLSAGWDGLIALWDVTSGEIVRRYEAHEGRVFDVNFSADGSRFLSAGGDGNPDDGRDENVAYLWDTASGEILMTYTGHTGDVNSAVFSPDESLIATSSGDGTIRLWDAASGEALRVLEGHTATVNEVRFSPDGQTLVSTSWDDTVRLWDVATGEELRQFVGHTNNTFGLAFTQDGGGLLTTSTDQTVRLWDVASGEELHRYIGHSDWVQEIVLSSDDQFAISAAQDESARVWRVATTTDALIDFALRNRTLRPLSCDERERYRLPACPVDV